MGLTRFCVFRSIPAKRTLAKGEFIGYLTGMNYLNRITFNPKQCGGRPCVRGMRMRVKDVLELLAHGASHAEILQDYPYLEEEDIQACLQYAAAQVDHTVLHAA